MKTEKFVYVMHIRTTPEKLWAALTGSEFWQGFSGPIESDWKLGSTVKFFLPDGKLYCEGVVLESKPHHTLSYTWPDPEGEQSRDLCQRLTWRIEASGPETVKLTMLHDNMTEKAYRGVSNGWPIHLNNLKTLLEKGESIAPELKGNTMKIPFIGGCACGAVRYETTAEPVLMLHCHCRDCQRSSGGPFSSFVIVPTEAFKLVKGSLRFHASPSEAGGQTRRGFCVDCGAPVVVKPDAVPQFAAIRTASLDDPSWFNPQMDVWTSDAHAWDQMDSALPKFEKYPK